LELQQSVDIPFEEWGEGEKINIYITGQRVVNNAFYKLICEGKVYNNGVKSCEKDGIIIVSISSVQRGSNLNIVVDIDVFRSISYQYRVSKEGLFGASSISYTISYTKSMSI
jgi:hypothetical protein